MQGAGRARAARPDRYGARHSRALSWGASVPGLPHAPRRSVTDHDSHSTPQRLAQRTSPGSAFHWGALPAGAGTDVARALFEQSPFSKVLYDTAGRILAVNAAFERVFGLTVQSTPAAGHLGAWEWDIAGGRVHWSETLQRVSEWGDCASAVASSTPTSFRRLRVDGMMES